MKNSAAFWTFKETSESLGYNVMIAHAVPLFEAH